MTISCGFTRFIWKATSYPFITGIRYSSSTASQSHRLTSLSACSGETAVRTAYPDFSSSALSYCRIASSLLKELVSHHAVHQAPDSRDIDIWATRDHLPDSGGIAPLLCRSLDARGSFQMSNAFGQVSDSLSWFVSNYGTLATWRATTDRLREFLNVVEAPDPKEGITVQSLLRHAPILAEGLYLALPDGQPLADIGSWRIAPGSRWLIQGPSGSGKSTLMRAMAGFWPFGKGEIERPAKAHQLFLPQQSYLPIGTLKAALCYPSQTNAFTDEACVEAMHTCGLPLACPI